MHCVNDFFAALVKLQYGIQEMGMNLLSDHFITAPVILILDKLHTTRTL